MSVSCGTFRRISSKQTLSLITFDGSPKERTPGKGSMSQYAFLLVSTSWFCVFVDSQLKDQP